MLLLGLARNRPAIPQLSLRKAEVPSSGLVEKLFKAQPVAAACCCRRITTILSIDSFFKNNFRLCGLTFLSFQRLEAETRGHDGRAAVQDVRYAASGMQPCQQLFGRSQPEAQPTTTPQTAACSGARRTAVALGHEHAEALLPAQQAGPPSQCFT